MGGFVREGDEWIGDERRSSESGFSDDLLTLGGFVGETHAIFDFRRPWVSEVEGGVDETFGVVFLRVVEDLVCAAVFDEFSVLHDGDVVADGADDGEVVADEDVGQSVFGLESAQQFDDFDLDGAVEGRGGFVEEDELGPQDEGAGDGDALALSA